MKKLKDVFDLPLCAHDDCLIESSGNRCSEFDLMEQAELAAHAINHVDALVEALELLIQECGKIYSNSSALGDAELKAKIALANYRGEP